MDNFGSDNHFKTTNKRGGIVHLKTIPNSRVKIAIKNNKMDYYKDKKEIPMNGFSYSMWDYSNFDYSTTNQNFSVIKIKEKKIVNLALRAYTDEIDKPMGLYGFTIEAYLGGYIKR